MDDHLLAQSYFSSGLPLHIAEIQQSALSAHSHEFFEMVYVRRGQGAHYIEDTPYPISAGDLYVISPGEKHFYAPVGDSTLRIVNVLWMPSLVEELLRASAFAAPGGARKLLYVEPMLQRATPFAHRLHLAGGTAFRVESLLDEMRRELIAAAPDCEVLLRHLFCALLVLLSRAYNEQKGEVPRVRRPAVTPAQSVAARAIAYLESHHTRQVRVEEVAAHVAVSSGRLAHIFKERAGCGVIEYLHEYRIARACAALVQDDLAVGEIAAEVGYNDLRFFHRIFRRRTGCNPTHIDSGLVKVGSAGSAAL
jgi:AraC-like DNA-binding protein